jgi:hypothetical protein
VWTTCLRDLSNQREHTGGAGLSIERIRRPYRQHLRPERGAKSPRESERGWSPASIEKSGQDNNAPATIVIGDVVRLGAILSAQADSDEAAAGGQ